ncbi:MAG: response regulator [Deltaproteobacteria bacterium]|nr:response regulator [Deltaproteobacteria bacterium]
MSSSIIGDEASSRKYSTPLLLALIAAGLAGNYFKFPIFLNLDFLFGSIFAMLALQLFGVGRGVVAAATIACYTYILWNHPYAIIIMTAEVAAVGWLMTRRKFGMIQADTLYWLIVGIPLVYLFYHVVMDAPLSSTYITMTKQAVNGIANALVARMIFTGYALRARSPKISYREIIYNLLAFFVLCPALIMLAVSSRTDFNETDGHIRRTLIQDSRQESHHLETWMVNRKSAILALAEMAAPRSPQQMQSYLELTKRSDANFKRVGLLDREATITAYYPLLDELGQKNIGKNFADRPFIPQLKRTLKPMLSEVVMGRIGTPKPMVTMLAPVVIDEGYAGYVTGILSLQELQDHLDKSSEQNSTLYTLLDKNGSVIMTNRSDQKVMSPFVRGPGTLKSLSAGVSQWVPALPPNTPATARWVKSFYSAESTVGDLAEWRLILEQPVAPFQRSLYNNYTGKFTLLFLVLLLSLALAELLSRRIMIALEKLRLVTSDLPSRVVTDTTINWPESGIKETDNLINNFQEMSKSIQQYVVELKFLNDSLEQRVEERTNRIVAIMTELSIILDATPIGIAKIIDRKQVWVNHRLEELFMYSKEELESQTTRFLYASEQAYETLGQEAPPVLAQGLLYETVQEMVRRDGAHVFVRFIGKAIDPTDLSKGSLWLSEDITSQRQTEQMLLESNRLLIEAKEQAESANRAKSEFLSSMSHEIRTPMNGVIGMAQLLAMTELTEEQQTYVDALKVSGNNLLMLINDILDLSKIEAGKIRLEMAEFSLQHCINNIVLTQKALIHQKGLFLDVDVSEDVPLVLVGDELRVKQVVVNLLGNATKFTMQGGITLSARLLEQQGSSSLIQLTVRDTGIGISAENLDKIFKPFTQEDGSTTRKFGGTGLGLTISLRMVELMGGNLSVESVQGSGSSFTVTLPFKISRNNSAVSTPDNTIEGIWGAPPLKILFVEDNPINMMFGISLLEKLGHEVVTKENGRECLSALEVDTFDLVLMDIQMPLMNGEEALLEIRRIEQETGFHQPVIALTAYALRGEKERFLATGFDGFVSKPLVINELIFEMKLAMGLAGITG